MENGLVLLKFRIRVYGGRNIRQRPKKMLHRKKLQDETHIFDIWQIVPEKQQFYQSLRLLREKYRGPHLFS